MEKPKREMSDEELKEFRENYRPPNPELGEIFVSALKAGIARQQREAEEAKKREGKPPSP